MATNTFQSSLVQYAGFTGTTGGIYIPTQVAGGAGGLQLAGTTGIGLTDTVEIAVPSTAKSVVVMVRDLDLVAGSISVFLESASAGFGAEITPPPGDEANNQVLVQAYSADSIVWVGSMEVGLVNGTTDAKTEMMAGSCLSPITKVVLKNVSSDFSAGTIWVFWQ